MTILKSLLASSILLTMTMSATVQSDELMDIIHPESADIFNLDNSLKASETSGVFSLHDDYSSHSTWSYEFEEYVDQADFSAEKNMSNTGLVNRYLESNPTGSGNKSVPVFKWDQTYDGFMIY